MSKNLETERTGTVERVAKKAAERQQVTRSSVPANHDTVWSEDCLTIIYTDGSIITALVADDLYII